MLTDKPRLPLKSIVLIGLLPSFLKRWIYRLRGYRIGKRVRFGLGSVLIGRNVEVGDDSQFGFLSVIRGDYVRIGSHVEVRAMSIFDVPHLELGDGTRVNEQVFAGGLQYADSKLVVGRNCQIMQMTFINPARSITIGDDTGIGGHCLLFGHSSWLSQFEGYPVEFEPIEIGSNVSLTWRVFVLPGTKIGNGAVIGANSLVRGSIPESCLAVGFPARVVMRSPEFPAVLTAADRRKLLDDLLADYVGYLQGHGYECRWDAPRFEVIDRKRQRTWRLHVLNMADAQVPPDAVDTLLSLCRIPEGDRALLGQRGVPWIDIEVKDRSELSNDLAEETVQFLRRYGLRFYRPGWPNPARAECLGGAGVDKRPAA